MRMLILITLLVLVTFSPVSHSKAAETPELSLNIATKSSADREHVFVFVKNAGRQAGSHTIAVDYGDGTSGKKTFSQAVGKNRLVSHKFVHRYANGIYTIKAVVSTPGELNTFNNAAIKTIDVSRNPAPKNTATGRAVSNRIPVYGVFSKLLEMLS